MRAAKGMPSEHREFEDQFYTPVGRENHEDHDPQNGAVSRALNNLEKQVAVAREQVVDMEQEFNLYLRPSEPEGPMESETAKALARDMTGDSPLADQLNELVAKMEMLNTRIRVIRNRNDLRP